MSALERLQAVGRQCCPGNTGTTAKERILAKYPDDIVITAALRTPLTKARRGGLKDTPLERLIALLLTGLLQKSAIDPAWVEDVCLGNVLHPDAVYIARAASLAAGLPPTTATSLTNRWCSSGLLAVQTIANQIKAGTIECGIAVGAESMSSTPDNGAPQLNDSVLNQAYVKDITMPMGWTSENVAAQFDISRAAQDVFAALSQQKAERAQSNGWTTDEILPLETTWLNPETKQKEAVIVNKDGGIRRSTTAKGLSKLKAAFPQWKPSTTTGGNASQITDGAAAVLLMKRSTAQRLGQKIIGKYVTSVVSGLEPRIMGIGPTLAIPKLLNLMGISLRDVDIVEINEAFASMGVYCQNTLNIPEEKLNPRGGAIALGHPLGCTGVRQIVTALSELKRKKLTTCVTSMCVGTGMGMAALMVSED